MPPSPLSAAFVSTFPPRRCGLATFTAHMIEAVKAAGNGILECRVVPIDPAWHNAETPPGAAGEVVGSGVRSAVAPCRITQGRPESYRAAALYLNAAPVDVVSIQYEFGLYGRWGDPFEDHLEGLLTCLRRPLVTTLHSVPPDLPDSAQVALRSLAARSRWVVVMGQEARRMLLQYDGVDPASIRVVPHGAPPVRQRQDRYSLRQRLGIENRVVILSLGLLDPRKGIEQMIMALPAIVRSHPDVLYLIAGVTHPDFARREGDRYRRSLSRLVNELGLESWVLFEDAYLSDAAFLDYLLAADVFVTPYLDPNQVTSGILSEALVAGKPIISTRYRHAIEMLSPGRGLLVDIRDPNGLARAVLRLLKNADLRQAVSMRAREYGRCLEWTRIGAVMRELLETAALLPADAAR